MPDDLVIHSGEYGSPIKLFDYLPERGEKRGCKGKGKESREMETRASSAKRLK